MADPVGFAASVIAIANPAFNKVKNLSELVERIQYAPKTLKDVNDDLSAIQSLLKSIISAVEDSTDNNFSDGVKKCLEEMTPALEGCGKACEEFAEKLDGIMSYSGSNQSSKRDGAKAWFKEKQILAFGYRIGSYKATFNIASNLASLKTASQNQSPIRDLQSTIESAMDSISGQIEGLEIGVLAIMESAPEKWDAAVNTLEQRNLALGQCLKACTTALAETSKATGTVIQHANALNEATQLMGVIGTVEAGGETATIVEMTAKDSALQFGGNIGADVALAALKGRKK